MDDFFSILFGLICADYDKAEKVGRTRVGEYTIDTCDTVDQGWETAVWKGSGTIVIVQRYNSKEEAKEGHEAWCTACTLNPTKVWSVQLDEYIKL